ncbi:MAG: SusF/SusE family outer membrane protein [Alistipes sp.]|nr:SusF/SusE family outer membrane protein [Alistipes sp.]
MKKLLYSILALAGVAATSCTQEHIEVVYNPENVTAAEIVDVKAGNLASGVATDVNYTDVNYNISVSAPAYTLYVAPADTNMEGKRKVSVDFATATVNEDGTKTVSVEAKIINQILTKNFKAEYDKEFAVDFQIETCVTNDKNVAVSGTAVYSNIVKATYVPFEAKEALPDAEEFGKIWVIGNYCGWDHSKTLFLFDYKGEETVYSGVIDFAGKAADGFKLTGVAGWDDSCNWGCDGANLPTEQEPASIQLISAGNSQDIKVYSKRYYKFSFDKSTLVLTKEFGFDSVGIIGVGKNWDADAVQMEFNPTYYRFFADVTLAAGDEIKCRADGGWDINWGVDATPNGDNFKVSDAGNYRVYLNLNKGTFEINADMYGKAEPGMNVTPETPVDPSPKSYGLVGSLTDWGNDMIFEAHSADWLKLGNVEIPADAQFKVRVNASWDENYGGAGDVEPLAITAGEKVALVAGGKNLTIAAGAYDIYFNPTTTTLCLVNAGDADPTLPAGAKAVKILGDLSATGWTNANAWIWDAAGVNYTGGTWPGLALEVENIDGKDYYVFNADATMYGKTVNVIFGNGAEQTVDITGVTLTDDVVITLTEKNDEGKWLATVNGEAPEAPEQPETPVDPSTKSYGLVGSLTDWGNDMIFEAHSANWLKLVNVEIPADAQFKVRVNASWDENYGGAGDVEPLAITAGEKVALVAGGKNLTIAAGAYDIYFNISNHNIVMVATGSEDPTVGAALALGLVGTINNWTAPDIAFEYMADGGYKILGQTITAADWFKIRANGEWNNAYNYGLATKGVLTVNAANTLINGAGSKDMAVPADGTYDLYFYPEELTLYVMEAGQVPQR